MEELMVTHPGIAVAGHPNSEGPGVHLQPLTPASVYGLKVNEASIHNYSIYIYIYV